ncbi:MAG: DivIVA domain-containing protein [Breznakia sp.]
MEKCNLDIEKILQKQFHIDLKGYAMSDVDTFLDLIIQDYETFTQNINELGVHLQNYENENRRLKNKIQELNNALRLQDSIEPVVEQVDILKRITNLENTVFKK